MQIFIASAKIGAIATLLNFAYTPAELHSALTYTSESIFSWELGCNIANHVSSQDKIMVPVLLFHAFGLIIGKHFLVLDRRTCVLMLIYDDRPLHNTNYWCHDCAAF